MAVPTYSHSWTTFVSSTMEERRKDIIRLIWAGNPLLAYSQAYRKPQRGGRKIFIPVEYGKNTSINRPLGRGSKIDLVQDEIITYCEYDWVSYGGGVIRYRDDDLENTGKYAVFNLVQEYITNMINTFKEQIEKDLFSTESTGSNKFCGYQGLVEDVTRQAHETSPTAPSGTVGNLNRATYPWWGNWGRDMSGKDVSTWLKFYMREGCDNVNHYTMGDPEVMIGHYLVKNMYEDLCFEKLRLMNVKIGDLAFKLTEWKGIPFITSPQSLQDRLYFVGKNAFEFFYEPRMWFKNTPWKEPTQQPFDYARQTVAKGQHVIKNPRAVHVLYDINES